MLKASRVEFMDKPDLKLGDMISGREVTEITVYHTEFEDHSEMIVIAYSGKEAIKKWWDFPCCVTFLLPEVKP